MFQHHVSIFFLFLAQLLARPRAPRPSPRRRYRQRHRYRRRHRRYLRRRRHCCRRRRPSYLRLVRVRRPWSSIIVVAMVVVVIVVVLAILDS